MERQLRVNWSLLVEEAKQRRKAQNLTQRRLAELAGVSAPTVSHFEGGDRDVQLSSVSRIFAVLGMLDERVLEFDEDARVRWNPDRDALTFRGRDGDRVVQVAISGEALADHFDVRPDDQRTAVRAFEAHRERLQQAARRKYLGDVGEPTRELSIGTRDL
jgi:transcriptional regulator with XRE-family HTH domain